MTWNHVCATLYTQRGLIDASVNGVQLQSQFSAPKLANISRRSTTSLKGRASFDADRFANINIFDATKTTGKKAWEMECRETGDIMSWKTSAWTLAGSKHFSTEDKSTVCNSQKAFYLGKKNYFLCI